MKTRISLALELLNAIETTFPQFKNDGEINGADLVDLVASILNSQDDPPIKTDPNECPF